MDIPVIFTFNYRMGLMRTLGRTLSTSPLTKSPELGRSMHMGRDPPQPAAEGKKWRWVDNATYDQQPIRTVEDEFEQSPRPKQPLDESPEEDVGGKKKLERELSQEDERLKDIRDRGLVKDMHPEPAK